MHDVFRVIIVTTRPSTRTVRRFSVQGIDVPVRDSLLIVMND